MNIRKGKFGKGVLSFGFSLIFLFTAFSSFAADFPKGPMNFWVPFNPGGETDIEIRALQPSLEKILGVPLVINYLPGAGGALCWSKLAAAKPDGYTIGGVNIPHIILQPEIHEGCQFQDRRFRDPLPYRIYRHRVGGEKGFSRLPPSKNLSITPGRIPEKFPPEEWGSSAGSISRPFSS